MIHSVYEDKLISITRLVTDADSAISILQEAIRKKKDEETKSAENGTKLLTD
jgi:hypothetical protein